MYRVYISEGPGLLLLLPLHRLRHQAFGRNKSEVLICRGWPWEFAKYLLSTRTARNMPQFQVFARPDDGRENDP